MRRTWSMYNAKTGEFIGKRYSAASDVHLARNIPDGCAAIEGAYELTHKVDVSTGLVVEEESTEALDGRRRIEDRRSAITQIESLERRQLRHMRQLRRRPNDQEAARALDDTDAEIESLRARISDETDTSEP